jgi:hypothetical protein
VTSDGEELGKVKEVRGDTDVDIFDGLIVGSGLLGIDEKYVPGELVESIDTEAVHITIARAEAEQLEQYQPPGGAE